MLAVIAAIPVLAIAQSPLSPRTASLSYAGVLFGTIVAGVWFRRQAPYAGAAKAFAYAEVARAKTARGQRIDTLLELSPREFEFAIARMFEAEGWEVQVTPGSGDGGKDLILTKHADRVFVELKRHAASNKIGRPAIMKLHSAIVHEGATAGIFVTTSTFSEPAQQFARVHAISLIDSGMLAARLASVFPHRDDIGLRGMCQKCSSILPFPETRLQPLTCQCGATVKSPLAYPVVVRLESA